MAIDQKTAPSSQSKPNLELYCNIQTSQTCVPPFAATKSGINYIYMLDTILISYSKH